MREGYDTYTAATDNVLQHHQRPSQQIFAVFAELTEPEETLAPPLPAARDNSGVSEPGRDLYPARDLLLETTCPACGDNAAYSVPVLVDWRDRARLMLLDSVFPTIVCVACGIPIPNNAPVVVLRPGDPIDVIVSGAATSGEHTALLTDLLAEYTTDQHGYTRAPLAIAPALLLQAVAARYLGFALQNLDEPDTDHDVASQPADEWVTHLRSAGDWPDLRAHLASYLAGATTADTNSDELIHPSLVSEPWQPAVRLLADNVRRSQASQEQALAVSERMRELSRHALAKSGIDSDSAATRRALDLLAAVTTAQSRPNRTQADVRAGIASGRQLLAHLGSSGLGSSPLALTAVNDTAALMLDDSDPDTAAEALMLLGPARVEASARKLPILADIATNYALAHLRNDRVADAATVDHVRELLEDAYHLHSLYFADKPERSLSVLTNVAAMHRSRLTGDPLTNVQQALLYLRRTRNIDDSGSHLTRPDRIMLESNYVSALSDEFNLEPTQAHADRLFLAVDALAPQLDELAPTHPTRLRTLANFGNLAVAALSNHENLSLPSALSELAEGWLSEAIEHSTHLRPDDATRVLAISGLAALLAQRGTEGFDRAAELLTACLTGLEGTEATRLHHTVVDNLGRLHLMRGDWLQAIAILERACAWADDVIAATSDQATRLAHVAAAGDLYQRLALCYVQQRDARSAIHTVERSRARWTGSGDVDTAVAAQLTPGSALLYIGTTGIGSYAVVLVAGRGAGAWTATLTTRDLTPSLAAVQTARTATELADALDRCAELLHAGLLNPAIDILRSEGAIELNVIASGPLAGLPITALPGPGGALADTMTIRYMVNAHPDIVPDRTSARRMVAITDPTHDLIFAAAELNAVQAFAPDAATPPPGVGVRKWLADQLSTATHLHLACHGQYEPANPFASHFLIGDNLALTLADLAAMQTPALELVVATACQSGVIDQRGADELVGLAYALLAAGARAAIAALWRINDAGTALLIALFYSEMAAGARPPAALRTATAAIRDATITQLTVWAATQAWVPPRLRPELDALRHHPAYRDANARPFAHPAHWAGLVYIQR